MYLPVVSDIVHVISFNIYVVDKRIDTRFNQEHIAHYMEYGT